MAFQAKLFIQGVGSYVPHTNGGQLLVLFPNQAHSDLKGLPKPRDRNVCHHYAVIQMDARSLDRDSPELWLSLFVQDHWVGVGATGASAMTDVDTKLAGFLPAMGTILKDYPSHAPLREDVLPRKGEAAKRLKAGLFLDVGQAKSVKSYEEPIRFVWSDQAESAQDYELTATSVVEVDLGEGVTSFDLKLRPLGVNQDPDVIPLSDIDGKLEIWVRHFCDIEPPADQSHTQPGDVDSDFVLNYALRPSVRALLQATGNRVPVPKFLPRASKPRQCMGALEAAASFSSPF